MTPLQLRRTVYRGQPGWLICGGRSSPGYWGVSIFFEHESAARRTIARMRASDVPYETTLADFEAEGEG